jgi:hypothetical protein
MVERRAPSSTSWGSLVRAQYRPSRTAHGCAIVCRCAPSWGSCEPSAGHSWARRAWLRWTLTDACGLDFGVDPTRYVFSWRDLAGGHSDRAGYCFTCVERSRYRGSLRCRAARAARGRAKVWRRREQPPAVRASNLLSTRSPVGDPRSSDAFLACWSPASRLLLAGVRACAFGGRCEQRSVGEGPPAAGPHSHARAFSPSSIGVRASVLRLPSINRRISSHGLHWSRALMAMRSPRTKASVVAARPASIIRERLRCFSPAQVQRTRSSRPRCFTTSSRTLRSPARSSKRSLVHGSGISSPSCLKTHRLRRTRHARPTCGVRSRAPARTRPRSSSRTSLRACRRLTGATRRSRLRS